MIKGVVLKKKPKTLVVMTPKGEYREVAAKKRNPQVGEQITFRKSDTRDRRDKLTWPYFVSSLAVAAIISFFIFGGFGKLPNWFGNRDVVGYITLDINPSIEIGIDKLEKVREVEGLNAEGEALIKGLVYRDKSFQDVVTELLTLAEPAYLSTGKADLLYSAVTTKETRLLDTRLASDLREVSSNYLTDKHGDNMKGFSSVAFAVSSELHDAAKKAKISSGKYAAYLVAKSNGFAVTLDEFRADSVTVTAANFPGMSAVLVAKSLTKEDLTALVNQEKSGELDRKLAGGGDPSSEPGATDVWQGGVSDLEEPGGNGTDNGSGNGNGTKEPEQTRRPTPKPSAKPTPTPTDSTKSPATGSTAPSSSPGASGQPGGSDSGTDTGGVSNPPSASPSSASGIATPGASEPAGGSGSPSATATPHAATATPITPPATPVAPTTPVPPTTSGGQPANSTSQEDCGWLGC